MPLIPTSLRFRWTRGRRVLAIVAACALFVWAFDWVWFRPLIRHYIHSHSGRSVGSDRLVLTRIDLVDAEVDLERRADGERNWRLRHPDDRGPSRVEVMSLDATRSELRFVHGGIG